MNQNTPESWPTGWTGNTVIDCTDAGRFCCTILVDGDPSTTHHLNFEEILRRWPEMWPEIEDIVSCVADSDNAFHNIRKAGGTILINIPSQPITEGVNWSVGVQFSHNHGICDVPVEGWTPTSDHAQMIY